MPGSMYARLDGEVAVDEVDAKEARKNLDELARSILGISGEEFQRRRETESLDDLRKVRGFTRVLSVATLLD